MDLREEPPLFWVKKKKSQNEEKPAEQTKKVLVNIGMKLIVVHCFRAIFANKNLHRLKLQQLLIQVAAIMYS